MSRFVIKYEFVCSNARARPPKQRRRRRRRLLQKEHLFNYHNSSNRLRLNDDDNRSETSAKLEENVGQGEWGRGRVAGPDGAGLFWSGLVWSGTDRV